VFSESTIWLTRWHALWPPSNPMNLPSFTKPPASLPVPRAVGPHTYRVQLYRMTSAPRGENLANGSETWFFHSGRSHHFDRHPFFRLVGCELRIRHLHRRPTRQVSSPTLSVSTISKSLTWPQLNWKGASGEGRQRRTDGHSPGPPGCALTRSAS